MRSFFLPRHSIHESPGQSLGVARVRRARVTRREHDIVALGFKSFALGVGAVRLAQAFRACVDHMTNADLRAARRVSLWVMFSTQSGALVILSGEEGPKGRTENEFVQWELPLSTTTSASTRATMRVMACGETVSARQLALARTLRKIPLIVDTRRRFACRPPRAATIPRASS